MKFDTRQIKEIMHLAWPAIIQEAMAVVVVYADTAMVGKLGANASAAVGLTSTFSWLITSVCLGFGVGILAVAAKNDGRNDLRKTSEAAAQALYLTILLGIILTIICLLISPMLPIWLKGDPVIQKDASKYFALSSASLLFKTSVLVLGSALRGVSDMKTPMYINVLTNIINIVLNFFLIYPSRKVYGINVYGAGLGVSGAAIATSIAFTVGGILMFHVYFHNQRFNFKTYPIKYSKSMMNECLRISVPVVLERSVICFGHVAFSSLIANLGVIPFAAHTIAIQAEQAFYIPGYAFQSSCATLVGNAIGQKDEKKVYSTTYTISTISFSIMAICGLILFIYAEKIMGIFTPDQEVIILGAKVLRIVSVSEPIFGVLCNLEGTFNGMGDTKAPFIFSLFTMWFIRVLGSFIAIHVFHFSLTAVWIMMVADNVTRCILLITRFKRGSWKGRLDF